METYVQVTLEQYGFELCRPTYMWIFFFSINNTVLHDPELLEFIDAELAI